MTGPEQAPGNDAEMVLQGLPPGFRVLLAPEPGAEGPPSLRTAAAGMRELARALSFDAPDREGAFHLLAADALLTLAAAAAVVEPDPEAALGRVARAVGRLEP